MPISRYLVISCVACAALRYHAQSSMTRLIGNGYEYTLLTGMSRITSEKRRGQNL